MQTGWWPPGIDFDIQDMYTVSKMIEEQRKNGR